MKRAIIIGVLVSHNAIRFAVDAMLFRKMRQLYPELFDPVAAAASVAASIAAYMEDELA